MTRPSTAVRERPIIMSGESVRSILRGAKRQTRRVLKPQPLWHESAMLWLYDRLGRGMTKPEEAVFDPPYGSPLNVASWECPFGQPGERLWVRETWAFYRPFAGDITDKVIYRADFDECGQCPLILDGEEVRVSPRDGWRSPIHMPRRHSRLTLEIESVRVERVQDIWLAHKDGPYPWDEIFAEGIPQIGVWDGTGPMPTPLSYFIERWNAINAKHPWASNPFVWAIAFKVVQP